MTLVISVVRWMVVILLRPGPFRLSTNWNASPGLTIDQFGRSPKEVHPLTVVLETGLIGPSGVMFTPLALYSNPVEKFSLTIVSVTLLVVSV